MAYPKSPAIALWNPVWTVIWSYIFTPVFGAFLQRTNWSEMGERDRTANSNMWMVLGLVFMFGYLILEPWLPESNYENFYFLGSTPCSMRLGSSLTAGLRCLSFVTDTAITTIIVFGANRLCSAQGALSFG